MAILECRSPLGGSALPVVDTTAIVKGSADATKLFRLEVDGFTSGVTRVGTPPDQDFTFAGLEVPNIFTAVQTVDVPANVVQLKISSNTLRTDTASNHNVFQVVDSSGNNVTRVTSVGQQIWDFAAGSQISYTTPGGHIGFRINNTFALGSANAYDLSFIHSGGASQSFAIYRTDEVDTRILMGAFGSQPNSYLLELRNDIASKKALVIKAETAQSVNLQEWQDVSGNVVGFFGVGTDAGTGDIVNNFMIGRKSTNTPAVNFGVGFQFELHSSTTVRQNAALIKTLWATATHATRKARSIWSVWDLAEREGIRIEASGTVAMLGFYGVAAVVKPTALTTALTQISHTGPGTPDYAIATPIDSGVGSAWGFSTQDEFETVMSVVLNLQTRLDELETKQQGLGLLT